MGFYVVAAKLINVYETAIVLYLFVLSWLQTGMILVSAQRSRLCNSDKMSGVALFILHWASSVLFWKRVMFGKRNLGSVWK